MAIVNDQTDETFLKVLYVGCAGCGKSTNIQWLFKQTSTELPSKHFDLGSFSKNNSAFEFLPISLEGEKKVRLHLFSMPAHNLWETVPHHLLLGVDGIVFVVDTRLSKLFDNETQLQRLESLVRTTGRSLWDIPMVYQYNHRDAPDAVPIHTLTSVYSREHSVEVESVATKGMGVFEAVDALTDIMLNRSDLTLKNRSNAGKSGATPTTSF